MSHPDLRLIEGGEAPQREGVEVNEFGEERYCYINGQRYLVGRVLTFHPHAGDSNFDFEQRMDRTVHWLYATRRVLSVSLTFEKRAGAHVVCVMTLVFPPLPAPIAEDVRPAGGRMGGRGVRGGVARRMA